MRIYIIGKKYALENYLTKLRRKMNPIGRKLGLVKTNMIQTKECIDKFLSQIDEISNICTILQ